MRGHKEKQIYILRIRFTGIRDIMQLLPTTLDTIITYAQDVSQAIVEKIEGIIMRCIAPLRKYPYLHAQAHIWYNNVNQKQFIRSI